MSEHWVKQLKQDHHDLKSTMAMQALANYIVLTMPDSDVARLIPFLQDPTKVTTVSIEVRDRKKERSGAV